jgi:hypothetical protein
MFLISARSHATQISPHAQTKSHASSCFWSSWTQYLTTEWNQQDKMPISFTSTAQMSYVIKNTEVHSIFWWLDRGVFYFKFQNNLVSTSSNMLLQWVSAWQYDQVTVCCYQTPLKDCTPRSLYVSAWCFRILWEHPNFLMFLSPWIQSVKDHNAEDSQQFIMGK